ncbi:MAG: hypothetical protein AAF581_02790 [Planctomycetota bacterium]
MRLLPTLTLRSSYAQITLGPLLRLFSSRSTVALLALTCAAWIATGVSTAVADEIHLHGGRTVSGKVVQEAEDNNGVVVVQLASGGLVRIPVADVARIERGLAPREEFAAREKALPRGSSTATYQLATWARKNGLRSESERLLWRVLDLYPQHRQAREALGFRRLGALWLTEDDYQRATGKIQLDGKWLTRQQYLAALKKADTEQVATAQQLLADAAGHQPRKVRQQALERFRAMPARERSRALVDASESPRWRERQFAVREFAQLDDPSYRSRLAHVAVTDGKRSVRDEALRVLKKWNHADTALSFIPYVGSGDERQRVNAVRALNVFPDKRAAGTLIDRASQIYGSFGRVHFASVVQRAYVKDYELVSGGTGLVVQEVADPVIDTMNTGVVLDIEVKRVELVSIFATLGRISGERYGTNVPKWREWWAEETGKPQTAQDSKKTGRETPQDEEA